MPCQYYMPGEEEAIARKELHKVTRMLCELMGHLERYGGGSLPFTPELTEWGGDHKRKDADRLAAERQSHRDRIAAKHQRIADMEAELARLKAEA